MDKKKNSRAREAIQWAIAVVLVLSGLLVWRLGAPPAVAQEGGGDPIVQDECE
jgi:hypothetical protein